MNRGQSHSYNSRVALARMEERMALLSDAVAQLRIDIAELRAEMRCLVDDHEKRLRAVEQQSVVTETRLSIATALLAALQVVMSAIAAWLGIRK